MDELVSPSSCSPPSFSGTACFPVLEFEVCEVPEQWLLGDDALDVDTSTWASQLASSDLSRNPTTVRAERTTKRRGRKPGTRTGAGPPIGHVEAERQRREKLNRRFCDLRAAVPTVSRMDKASLLADAAAYIAELRHRVERFEAEAAAARKAPPSAAAAWAGLAGGVALGRDVLEVRMVGRDAAMLRLTTTTATTRHAPARLMCALRALNLPVKHASVARVGGATVQDVMVDDVPAALQDEGCLRAALLHRLQHETGVCSSS